MAVGIGSQDYKLSDEQIEQAVLEGTSESLFRGKKVLVLTPDSTRSSPLSFMERTMKRSKLAHGEQSPEFFRTWPSKKVQIAILTFASNHVRKGK